MTDLELQDVPERIKQGMALVERGALGTAQELFEAYYQANPTSALALSFVGMLKAAHSHQYPQGVSICQEAIKKDPQEALCHLNLSKAYFAGGDRYQCVRALHRGLKLRSPHNTDLMVFYPFIGLRRKPVLPFLSRDNPI